MSTPHDIDRLKRVRAVTGHYSDFQGLYMCLMGLFLVLMSFARPGSDLLLVGVLVTVVLLFAVRRYYRRRFGEVRPRQTPQRVLARVFVPLLLLASCLVAVTVANAHGVTGTWLFAVFAALALTLGGGPNWRLRLHYPISAAVLLLLLVLPLDALLPSGEHPFDWERPVMVTLVAGALLMVNGLLNHRTLVRTLTPVGENGTD